ncbi:MAG TPA: hypothetical protein VK858_21955 [Longimicrobiales bacterium]|nr:hypothetical protein [Longimicrobiales bacterium]
MTTPRSSRSTGAPGRRLAGPLLVLLLGLPAAVSRPHHDPAALPVWGADGHRMAARAAIRGLPSEAPAFFRDAGERLAWLNPEPDRWRVRELREMDQAWTYDHYIDLENIPAGSRATDAPHRYAFLRSLWEAGVDRPERDVGLLPWRILELQQRLTSLWGRWAAARSGEERAFLEARILDDAGILGHYVTDASQPHHTTIHFDGWNAARGADAPNPEGFTEERGFHGRFETAFVSAHVGELSVVRRVPPAARDLGDTAGVREAVWAYLRDTHAQVETLYRLEQRHGFDPGTDPAPEARTFAEARLAAGATMLRDLWWTAYRRGTEGR